MAAKGHLDHIPDDQNVCQLCGKLDNLSLCTGCRYTWYCCKEHQKADWKQHKGTCSGKQKKGMTDKPKVPVLNIEKTTAINPVSCKTSKYTLNSSDGKEGCLYDRKEKLEDPLAIKNGTGTDKVACEVCDLLVIGNSTISCTCTNSNKDELCVCHSNKHLNYGNDDLRLQNTRVGKTQVVQQVEGENSDNSEAYFAVLKTRFAVLAKYVIDCLNKYGICVIDNFLGDSKGTEILEEVKKLRSSGVFTEGQLVNSASNSSQTIRGDILTWVDGKEEGCQNIHFLISCMDAVILRCGRQLEQYDINERTKAMVACYPGKDTGYVRHVDNPNGDGRCVTCIYYLNKNWEVMEYGGMLRIYPDGQDQVANIEPTFDRLLFFWSDRRNPHEVRPSQVERYAITVWYYDKEERGKALKQLKGQNGKNPRKVAVPLINNNG